MALLVGWLVGFPLYFEGVATITIKLCGMAVTLVLLNTIILLSLCLV